MHVHMRTRVHALRPLRQNWLIGRGCAAYDGMMKKWACECECGCECECEREQRTLG